MPSTRDTAVLVFQDVVIGLQGEIAAQHDGQAVGRCVQASKGDGSCAVAGMHALCLFSALHALAHPPNYPLAAAMQHASTPGMTMWLTLSEPMRNRRSGALAAMPVGADWKVDRLTIGQTCPGAGGLHSVVVL